MRAILLPFLLAPVAAISAPLEYTLDPDHTYPSMEVPHMGNSIFRGKFNHNTGTATMDAQAHTGTIEVHIDTASVDFGHDKVNEHLASKEFFDVAKYPEAVYKGTLRFDGDQVTGVDGTLTLLGVSKPVPLVVTMFKCIEHPYYKKPYCAGDASGKLDRADFGMGMGAENGQGWVKLQIQFEAFQNMPPETGKPAG